MHERVVRHNEMIPLRTSWSTRLNNDGYIKLNVSLLMLDNRCDTHTPEGGWARCGIDKCECTKNSNHCPAN